MIDTGTSLSSTMRLLAHQDWLRWHFIYLFRWVNLRCLTTRVKVLIYCLGDYMSLKRVMAHFHLIKHRVIIEHFFLNVISINVVILRKHEVGWFSHESWPFLNTYSYFIERWRNALFAWTMTFAIRWNVRVPPFGSHRWLLSSTWLFERRNLW